MRIFVCSTVGLLIAILSSAVAANPYVLVMLQAQRTKCVTQYPELRPQIDQAIEKMAVSPPKGVTPNEWKDLLSIQVESDPTPGQVSADDCLTFAARLTQLDLGALFDQAKASEAEFDAAQRSAPLPDPLP